MADPKDIGTAQKGTVARHLLGELSEPLDKFEREALEMLLQYWRGGECDCNTLMMHVANLNAARNFRDRMESQINAGRRAGQRL